MACSQVTLFWGLPPEYWTAITSIIMAFLGIVALTPVFRDWVHSCRQAAFLRRRIYVELEVLRQKLEYATAPSEFRDPNDEPFEAAHRLSFDNLRELFSISGPLRSNQQNALSVFVIGFRPSEPMDKMGLRAFLNETKKMLKVFPAPKGVPHDSSDTM